MEGNAIPSGKSPDGAGTGKEGSENGQKDDNPGTLQPASPCIGVFNLNIPAEELHLIRQALTTVGELASSTDLSPEDSVRLEDAKKTLEAYNSKTILAAIWNLQGQELQDELHNVSVWGEMLDSNIVLSGLSMAVLMNFIGAYVPENLYRRCIGMIKCLIIDNDRIIEPIVNLYGTSKDRTYKAINELLESGLYVDIEHPNQRGAGRPSATEIFREQMMPVVLGAEIDAEELSQLQRLNRIEELVGKPVETVETDVQTAENDVTENAEEHAPENGSATEKNNEETKEKDEKQPEIEDGNNKGDADDNNTNGNGSKNEKEEKETPEVTPVTMEKLVNIIRLLSYFMPGLLERLRMESQRSRLHGSKGDLLNGIAVLLSGSYDRLIELYSDLRYKQLAAAFSSPVFQTEGEMAPEIDQTLISSEEIFEPFLIRLMADVACPLLDLVNLLMYTFIGLPIEESSSYWVYKEVKKVINENKLNRLTMYINDIWSAYPLIVDAIKYAAKETVSEDKKDDETTESVSNDDRLHLDTARIYVHYKEALNHLDTLISLFEEASKEIRDDATIPDVLEFLHSIREQFEKAVGTLAQHEGDEDITAVLSVMVESFRTSFLSFLHSWDRCNQLQTAVRVVGGSILSDKFQKLVFTRFSEYKQSSKSASKTTSDDTSSHTEDDTVSQVTDPQIEELLQEAKKAAEQKIQDVLNTYEELKKKLENGGHPKRKAKESNIQQIKSAVACLDSVCSAFNKQVELITDSNIVGVWKAMESSAWSLYTFLQTFLDQWNSMIGLHKTEYSAAVAISKRLVCKKFGNNIDRIKKGYENDVRKASYDEENPFTFVFDDVEDDMSNWYIEGCRLSVAGRLKLIREFWKAGKDPTDIKVWIDYIIGAETSRTYGGPDETERYAKITKIELKNAIAFLTGIEFSANSLWNILKKDMGYSGHQCVKQEQIGKPHPLRHKQYEHIKEKRRAADPKKTLILSIDTKSFILLGRLKHDNGVLMCSPGGGLYRVHDHDFGFKMYQIYPFGTSLVDVSRMSEKAVLHPVGVYCPNDKTGYVSLVLGKDTAEAMCNLIYEVIAIKRKTMPELESVLILADGGGANMANGIVWTDNLFDLVDRTGLNISISHFAPGCSRHNDIEHLMWRYISIHCKGKPFLNIETVRRLFNETKLGPDGNYVRCCFDPKKYLTNEEKRARGLPVLSRDELNAKIAGRIIYDFPEGNDMHKWNYSILTREASQKSA